MNELVQQKVESEIRILIKLIEHYKQNPSDISAALLVAYEYSLQMLLEIKALSQCKLEPLPF